MNFPSAEVVGSPYQFPPQGRQQSPEVSTQWGWGWGGWVPREAGLPRGAGASTAGPGRVWIAVFAPGVGQDFQLLKFNSPSPSCKTLQNKINTFRIARRLRKFQQGFWHWMPGMCSSSTLHAPGAGGLPEQQCLRLSSQTANKQAFTHLGECEKGDGRKLFSCCGTFLCCVLLRSVPTGDKSSHYFLCKITGEGSMSHYQFCLNIYLLKIGKADPNHLNRDCFFYIKDDVTPPLYKQASSGKISLEWLSWQYLHSIKIRWGHENEV